MWPMSSARCDVAAVFSKDSGSVKTAEQFIARWSHRYREMAA
jgi:hypothetical protein